VRRLAAVSGSLAVLHEDDFFHNRQVVSVGDTHPLSQQANPRHLLETIFQNAG
jgi:hypothetical protein